MGGTILTIDDEPAIRDLFGKLLEAVGYASLEASDGQEGLEMVRTEHPDLVICDLRMPGMDGLDVLSRIHEHDPDLPVIMVSGAGTMNDAVEALKRGAWDYMTKPISDVTLLYSAVTRGMERSRHFKQNREQQARLEQLNRELEEALGRLRTDQEAGRQIQFRLLPADAQLFGSYRFSRRLFPSLFLSGDFIDYFAIDDSHVGFFMADVSGHGAASAFVTVMVKTLVG
jgi:DNA-binding NtrC family response regulator